MCNCVKEVEEKLSNKLGKQGKIVNIELMSNRTYSTFKYQDGKRNKEMLILHSYCPHCGKKYEEEQS